MKLNYDRKSKDPTYFIQQGFRNGKKTTTKNIYRIGKHSELLTITDDPLSYAKKQVKKFNEEAKQNNKVTMEVNIDFSEKVKITNNLVSSSNLSNIGYFFLQQLYHELSIDSFFQKVTENLKITFDPNLVNRFLTYVRILEPDSKLGTYDHLNLYYEKPAFEYVHILRTMDILSSNYDEYIAHLFEYSNKILKRNTSVCYYDCSNYYFETETDDEDYIDEVTGELVKGLRKYGLSKDHKPNPIVEMGLFMDTNGIPLSMCITSGSDNEQTTAIPLERKLTSMLKGKKFIYCADAGLGSYNIRKFNSMGGKAFVVTQSIKKLSKTLKEAVFNDCDYRLLSNDVPVSLNAMQTFDKKQIQNKHFYVDKAYKIIDADNIIDLGLYEYKKNNNGTTRKVESKGVLKQRLIITFSRKMMEYQRHVRNKQINRAKKLLKKIDPETYKKGPNDITRFIKKVNGNNESIAFEINDALIKEEEKYDGFYAIATNLEDDAKIIIGINSNRYKIEDCFRVLKTNFASRPVFHHNKERIIAHFMICYTALLIYRLLENKLYKCGTHFTIDNIIETLKNMQITNVDDMFYQATYNGSDICTALNNTFNLGLDKKYYKPKELNKIIKKIL